MMEKNPGNGVKSLPFPGFFLLMPEDQSLDFLCLTDRSRYSLSVTVLPAAAIRLCSAFLFSSRAYST